MGVANCRTSGTEAGAYEDYDDRDTVAVRYTLVITLILGIGYPLPVTTPAQPGWRALAEGQLIVRNGRVRGTALDEPRSSVLRLNLVLDALQAFR